MLTSPNLSRPTAKRILLVSLLHIVDDDEKSLNLITANPLSISYIESAGGATCTFFGIDGSQTTVVGAQTVPVGPPQTQVSGSCLAL